MVVVMIPSDEGPCQQGDHPDFYTPYPIPEENDDDDDDDDDVVMMMMMM